MRPPTAPLSSSPNPSSAAEPSAAGPQRDMAPLAPSDPQVPALQPSEEPDAATADTAQPLPTLQRPDRITAAKQFAGRYLEYMVFDQCITRNAVLSVLCANRSLLRQLVDLDEVIGEKQRFVERWPERDYAVLPPRFR